MISRGYAGIAHNCITNVVVSNPLCLLASRVFVAHAVRSVGIVWSFHPVRFGSQCFRLLQTLNLPLTTFYLSTTKDHSKSKTVQALVC